MPGKIGSPGKWPENQALFAGAKPDASVTLSLIYLILFIKFH